MEKTARIFKTLENPAACVLLNSRCIMSVQRKDSQWLYI